MSVASGALGMSDTTALVLIVASVALAISMLLSARTRRMPASTRRESGAGLDITDVIIVLAVIGLAIIVDPSMIESLMAAGVVAAKVVGSIVLLVGLAVLLLVCAAVGTMWRIKSRLRTEARRARHMI